MDTTLNRAFVVAAFCGIFHIASTGSAIAQTDNPAIDGAPPREWLNVPLTTLLRRPR